MSPGTEWFECAASVTAAVAKLDAVAKLWDVAKLWTSSAAAWAGSPEDHPRAFRLAYHIVTAALLAQPRHRCVDSCSALQECPIWGGRWNASA